MGRTGLEAASRCVLVAAMGVVLSGAHAALALANPARVTAVKRVSGATPFPAKCGSTSSYQQGSEGEPRIAVNPSRPSNILIVHQQDRAYGGGALVNVVRVSTNSGRSWRRVRLPGASPCYGAARPPFASDPWVTIGLNDVAYFAQDIKDPTSPLRGSTIGMSRSTNGGRSWSKAVSLAPVDSSHPLGSDRATVTADPRISGRAYALWVRFGEPRSDVMFTRTVNAGRTWSTPREIYSAAGSIVSPGADHGPWGTQVSVLPDGTLLSTFLVFADPVRIMAMRSTDKGRTWSRPVKIGTASQQHPYDPDDKALEVRDEPAPTPAVGPDGTAYVAYYSVAGPRSSPIMLSRSKDGGRTWSSPKAIIRGRTQHFNPSLVALHDGTLGLTFYDFRRDKPKDGRLTTDYWFAQSRDRGASWNQVHLGGPFDALTAAVAVNPQATGRFLGEYQGLAPLGRGFASAFTMSKPAARKGPSDIFFARVRIGSGPHRR